MSKTRDSRVEKVLTGICWAKDCVRVSAVKEYFKKPWEDLEKPILCEIHQSYRREDTHYGEFNTAASKWSCCGKTYFESECEDIQKVLGPHLHEIKISPAQQKRYEERMRQMEARIESDFSSQNWDRS